MRKNVLFVFLCLSLFWGGLCWILFSLKIGIIAGFIAGFLGVLYYPMLVVGACSRSRKIKRKREI